jgi:hypothetical protein
MRSVLRHASKVAAAFGLFALTTVEADAAVVWANCTITNIGQIPMNSTQTQHIKCAEKLSGTNVDQYHVPISSADAARFIQAALAAKLAGRVFVVQVDNSTPSSGVCANSTLCRVPTAWYFN